MGTTLPSKRNATLGSGVPLTLIVVSDPMGGKKLLIAIIIIRGSFPDFEP